MERTQRTKAIIAIAPALLFAVVLPVVRAGLAQGGERSPPDAPTALVKAYPDFIDRIEGNNLVWKDGTRMRIDDGKGAKAFDAMLDDPDVKDMFLMKYPVGEQGLAPNVNFDPGRVRYAPLFKKIYGDCRTAGFMTNAQMSYGCRANTAKTSNSPKSTARPRRYNTCRTSSISCRSASLRI